MPVNTEEALDKLNERELIRILLSLQNKTKSANKHILEEVPVKSKI